MPFVFLSRCRALAGNGIVYCKSSPVSDILLLALAILRVYLSLRLQLPPSLLETSVRFWYGPLRCRPISPIVLPIDRYVVARLALCLSLANTVN